MTLAEMIDVLAVPRENGSAGLADAATFLEKALRATGAEVSLHAFACRPYAGRLAGVVALVLGLGFFALMWRRRFGWALLMALLLPTYLLVGYELRVPLISTLGAVSEANLVATFPVTRPERTVLLGAHYDTKTDLLDHYQRAPIQFLIVPVLLFAFAFPLTALWRQARGRPERHVRMWAVLVPLYFAAFFLAMTGGAFVSARSPGVIDDAAAVATLVKLGEHLGTGELKLEHTEVQIVLFAGEEIGLQGSAAFVADRLPLPVSRPTYFINGEAWGFGRALDYFTSDRSALRRYDASGALARTLDRAYRRVTRGNGLDPDIQPVTTDARSFMAAGIPSVTLGSHRDADFSIRGLHSAADRRERLQSGALEHTLEFLQAALAEIDARGVGG